MSISKHTVVQLLVVFLSCFYYPVNAQKNIYKVKRLSSSMKIDANWNKPQWKKCKAIAINNYMEVNPKFHPVVKAKMMYDSNNLYVIFKVKDRYVRCMVDTINGPVWQDACAEFFFAPDTAAALKYFNLEMNCGGTALMNYNAVAKLNIQPIDAADIKQITIAHSLPKTIEGEISKPVTWTLEYKLPLSMLEKYSTITKPKQGVKWMANFYKISHKSTNPHYITWNFVDKKEVDFHTPEFFGETLFQ